MSFSATSVKMAASSFNNYCYDNNSSSSDDESRDLELLLLMNLCHEEHKEQIMRQPCRDSALTGRDVSGYKKF